MFRKEHQVPHGRYITREEFSQYVQMGEKEYKRVNERLKILENMEDKIYQLISSIDKIANNVEHILKALERQEKRIDEHDVRLDHIATKGSKLLEDLKANAWKVVAGAAVAYILYKLGIFQVP